MIFYSKAMEKKKDSQSSNLGFCVRLKPKSYIYYLFVYLFLFLFYFILFYCALLLVYLVNLAKSSYG